MPSVTSFHTKTGYPRVREKPVKLKSFFPSLTCMSSLSLVRAAFVKIEQLFVKCTSFKHSAERRPTNVLKYPADNVRTFNDSNRSSEPFLYAIISRHSSYKRKKHILYLRTTFVHVAKLLHIPLCRRTQFVYLIKSTVQSPNPTNYTINCLLKLLRFTAGTLKKDAHRA